MARNANWDRWTLASIVDFFKTTFEDPTVNWVVYIAGVDLGEESDYADPTKPARLAVHIETDKRQSSKGEYWLVSNITLIVTTTSSSNDGYDHSRKVGILESKIPVCLPLIKKGDTLTNEVFCNLVLKSDLEPKSFPPIGQTARVTQTVYDLVYKGKVNGTD